MTLADPATLVEVSDAALLGERVLLAVAVRVGATRLIDNIVLGEDPPPPGGAPSYARGRP